VGLAEGVLERATSRTILGHQRLPQAASDRPWRLRAAVYLIGPLVVNKLFRASSALLLNITTSAA